MSVEDVVFGNPGPDGIPGTGGPGYRIKEEFTTNPNNSHVDGALAMARSQDPNSAVHSSISVLVHSMAWIPGTPYLVPLSREWTSFPS